MRLALMQETEWRVNIATPVDDQRTHSSLLIPTVQEALQSTEQTPQDLRRIVVNVGPGSFTGLRTSVSLAKTLGQFVPDCQLIALNTMAIEAMAWYLNHDKEIQITPVSVLLNARNQSAYTASFALNSHGPHAIVQTAEWVSLQQALAQAGECPVILSNIPELSGFKNVYPLCSEATLWPKAMAACLEHPVLHQVCTWQTLAPLYLQPPRATVKQLKNALAQQV
jgi:tRNA threonylcarbamoyl adenosine modification protein YeaZ